MLKGKVNGTPIIQSFKDHVYHNIKSLADLIVRGDTR